MTLSWLTGCKTSSMYPSIHPSIRLPPGGSLISVYAVPTADAMRIVWSRFSRIHKWCHIWFLHVHLFHYLVYAKKMFSLYSFQLVHIVEVVYFLYMFISTEVWCYWISGIKLYMDSAFLFHVRVYGLIENNAFDHAVTCSAWSVSNLQVGANRNDQRHCMHEPVLKLVLCVYIYIYI